MMNIAKQRDSLALPLLMKKAVLVWIGAIATVQDEFDTWVQTLIERGEKVEGEGREFMQRMVKLGMKKTSLRESSKTQATKPAVQVRMTDWCLSKMGRPTSEDTRRLVARITALEEKIAALD